ncbi:MAG: hypothetical protein K0U93_29420 [Gammaproteobacteria bacterium]|nr:hypothetical protein [Gammaproteobacteria bacterium]
MAEPTEQHELQPLSRALLRLDEKALGLAVGFVLGILVFGLTLFAVGTPAENVTGFIGALRDLEQVLWGYSISIVGSVIGFFYGFATGTLAGTATGHLYNFFSKLRRPAVDE